MIKNGESFIISGSKDLIFRMENDETLVFDPYDLSPYRLNYIATEMMYLIYKNYNKELFINYFAEKYKADEQEVINSFQHFISSSPYTRAIIPNIIQLGLLN